MKFKEIKDKYAELNNPSEFFIWLSQNIKIIRYVPIVRKYAKIKILSTMFLDEFVGELVLNIDKLDNEYAFMRYDTYVMFNLLFEYTDIEIEQDNITSENYDFVNTSGLFEHIMRSCANDYMEFKGMCDRAIGINNLTIVSKLNDVFEEHFNTDSMLEGLSEMKRLFKSKKVNDLINKINNIEMSNNGTLQKIIDITDRLKENNPIEE